MICMNCGSDRVERAGDNFTCKACRFDWTVADEQANAIYIRSQGREPAKSVFEAELVAEEGQPLIASTEIKVADGKDGQLPPADSTGTGEPENQPAPVEPSTEKAEDSKSESTNKSKKG
jgi:hypothetical protein